MIDTRSPDSFEWRFVLVALGILTVGVLSIYSVSPSPTPKGQTPLYAKQLAWILIGLVAFLAAVAIDYHTLTHLRTEARQALIKFRPSTFGQAGRLEGITPADLTLLSVLVHR